MVRTKKVFWLMISVCAVIVCWAGSKSLGDTANFVVDFAGVNQFSGKASVNIGAWYDEKWQASSFFLLNETSNTDEFRYERTSDPVTAPTGHEPIFRKGNSTIPQDVVVTSWRVSGHVHFASGM